MREDQGLETGELILEFGSETRTVFDIYGQVSVWVLRSLCYNERAEKKTNPPPSP